MKIGGAGRSGSALRFRRRDLLWIPISFLTPAEKKQFRELFISCNSPNGGHDVCHDVGRTKLETLDWPSEHWKLEMMKEIDNE
eukprot:scaffold48051_cov43-Cyclotella_meneghiniana.AAC.3